MGQTSLALPSIDQTLAGSWTQDDVNYYNKLPYYFVKATGAWQKKWPTWRKLLGTLKWQPNMGDTMRQVGLEPTPILRQMAFPSRISATPKADMVHMKERTTDTYLYWQQFATPHFNFLPSFQDFMKDKIAPYREDLNKVIEVFHESFWRTNIFHLSPYVYVVGKGLMDAPSALGNSAGTSGKTNAWLQADVLPYVNGGISFMELFKAVNSFEQEVGGTPYEGDGTPGGDSSPLNERFCLVGDPEVWNNFIDDPWLKENRPINMNIITDAFKGDIFAKIRFRHEKYGIRIKHDDNFSPSFPAPQSLDTNSSSPNYNRTMPNKAYAKEAQIGVAWLVGGNSYEVVEPGPPPSEFTAKDKDGLADMNWNGKIQLTKNFLVKVLDSAGNEVYDTNSWGHYLRMQAEATTGIAAYNKFNILPIFYQRHVGLSTAG